MGQLIGGCLEPRSKVIRRNRSANASARSTDISAARETYNDDITYEIAYLDGFIEKGYDITPADVAYKWLELISDGYSAEKTAIENLRRGLLPPESGTTNNYFYDWIGAQMRTPLHGMLAPRKPETRRETRRGRFDRLPLQQWHAGRDLQRPAHLPSLSRRTISGPLLRKRWT